MKRINVCTLLVLAVFALFPASAHGQSNAAPSLHIGLAPCQVFSGSLAADTTQGITVRGACNVPAEAVGVDLAVHISSAGAGSLKLWEWDGTLPSASAVSFGGGTASSFAVVRLCEPAAECLYDVSARSTASVTLTLVVEGYYAPSAE